MDSRNSFDEAIAVTPITSHLYSAVLSDEWCIGAVPHGGYTASILYRVAVTHFACTHPNFYNEPATPISMQLSFLRRTNVGPVSLTVDDVKLGARTSTLHITLQQLSEKRTPTGDHEQETKVAGYITVSPASAEVGLSFPTEWDLPATPSLGSGPNSRVNLAVLGQFGRDGEWMRQSQLFPRFRRVFKQLELYGPRSGNMKPGIVDQWARFCPAGDRGFHWTNEAICFLVDVFPMPLDGFELVESAAEHTDIESSEKMSKYWYPTVSLNIDIKKRLPVQGVEWLYSRVVTKVIRDGRMDLDVVVLDDTGDVVALSTQVGLVVSAGRNIGKRKQNL